MKRKILSLLTLLCMVTALLPMSITVYAAYTGTQYGYYLYYTVSDGEVTISDCSSSATEITIPTEIDGKHVTSIGDYAFYECSKLTSITIPDGVTRIGEYAFYECTGLTGVTIPSGVTSIGDDAFRSCTGLTSVTIGNGVTSIGYYAFRGCTGLTSVTIGNGVTSIGYYAFYNCSSLTSVNITDIAAWCNIDFVGYYSNPLYYAKKLYLNGELVTDLVIPDGVTSIGKYAFYNCTGLTSVTIPNSVSSIGTSAFYYCYHLKTVYYHGTEDEWNNISIGDDNTYLNNAKRIYFAYMTFLGEYKNADNVKKYPLNSCINISGFEEKNGYTLHFYSDKECTNEFDISTPITEDTTLYLKYVINQYTYKFIDNAVLKETTVDYGTTITPPETPADKGPYTFDYWDGYTDGMTLSDDVEFKAVYKYKNYKITADGLENPINVTYNGGFTIEPQKIDDYHYFIGYFTEPDGKGTQITNGKGESIKAYDVIGDLTVYPYFYSGYMNKVELSGTLSAMPGDTIKQSAIFATDKEAMYFVATVKYPEYLNFKNISGGDFAEASKDSEKTKDGFKYLDITCQYDYNDGNMPINQNLVPFEITFDVSTNAPVENANISIENVVLIGDDEYEFTDLTGNVLEIKPKLTESVSITGNNSIDKITKYSVTVLPDYTTDKAVAWSVDNEEIATISQDGTLTPVKNGTVTITATAKDGSGKSSSKRVNVTAYATITSLAYNDISIDIVPDKYDYTVYVKNSDTSVSLTPTFNKGTLKPNGIGSWISGRTKEFDLNDKETIITLNRYNVEDTTDSTYTVKVIKFEGTQTTVSTDGKTFTVTPINIASGNTVIIALYNGEKLVDTQSKTYVGESLTFETTQDYTSAKVFVWGSVTTATPICTAEIVK